jgi:DNA/RNA endonuclease YhcR with UshA esterase domain
MALRLYVVGLAALATVGTEAKMRMLVLAFGLLLTATPAFAETIPPSAAKNHVGQTVTVEGVVSEVHHAASGKVIFIDMGGRFPNNPFAAVIFKEDFDKFPDVDSLEGKTIAVTGLIKSYEGKPETILHDPGQIKAK